MQVVLNGAVKMINTVQNSGKQKMLFSYLFENMGSMHTVLLLRSEVRWLSRGKLFARLFELRQEGEGK